MNAQSMLFCPLDSAQLHKACQRYLGENLVSACLLEGGLFNTTYRLETATRKAILRLGPVNTHLLMPYERNLMQAECEIQKLLHAHGIPTSELVALDLSHEFLDRDVMVVACIPGVSLSTISVSQQQEKYLCRKMGELARKLHEITADQLSVKYEKPYGRFAAVIAGMGGASWSEAIRTEVALWRGQAEKVELFSKDDFDTIESIFAYFSAVLDRGCTKPRLVHADLWFGNLLVDEKQELLALIDGDRAIFGDPEFEFATGWITGKSFCEGYGRSPDASPEGVLRRRLYKLLLNLEDWLCLYRRI